MIAEIPSHSSFANLAPRDHAQILEWLLRFKLTDVQAFLAKPRPDGLAIHTSIMSISRYKRRYLPEFISELYDPNRILHSVSPSNPNKDSDRDDAILIALRHRLFRMTLHNQSDPFKIRALIMAIQKFEKVSESKPALPLFPGSTLS